MIDPKALEAARRIIDWNQRAPGTAALNVTVTAALIDDAITVARALLAGEALSRPGTCTTLDDNAGLTQASDSLARPSSSPSPAVRDAQKERMREVLEWLDRRGGLGFDAHDYIRSALSPLSPPEGGKP